mgnify:CR=1 FL=1
MSSKSTWQRERLFLYITWRRGSRCKKFIEINLKHEFFFQAENFGNWNINLKKIYQLLKLIHIQRDREKHFGATAKKMNWKCAFAQWSWLVILVAMNSPNFNIFNSWASLRLLTNSNRQMVNWPNRWGLEKYKAFLKTILSTASNIRGFSASNPNYIQGLIFVILSVYTQTNANARDLILLCIEPPNVVHVHKR